MQILFLLIYSTAYGTVKVRLQAAFLYKDLSQDLRGASPTCTV